ncbi:hypothetical protein LBMAG18_03990 [Alphaproteobacteria bacterium]|nr:hypothetical protein LBMAG18_03990 [Alphaproteobacteria bacterium]
MTSKKLFPNKPIINFTLCKIKINYFLFRNTTVNCPIDCYIDNCNFGYMTYEHISFSQSNKTLLIKYYQNTPGNTIGEMDP